MVVVVVVEYVVVVDVVADAVAANEKLFPSVHPSMTRLFFKSIFVDSPTMKTATSDTCCEFKTNRPRYVPIKISV